ncbi:hypothetical protein ACQ33O_02040 [Ferruginibacter sp. SUN002]|uniref:hypothetical protein n=1 Tax=Ferruginibacter sp. SUN002 TaxID=2937789 RepID=UPI003D369DD1
MMISVMLTLGSCTLSPDSKIVGVWESSQDIAGDAARFYFNKDKRTGHFWILNNKKLVEVINFNYKFSKDYKNMEMNFVSSNPRPFSAMTASDFFHRYDVSIYKLTNDSLKISLKISGISNNYDLKKIK